MQTRTILGALGAVGAGALVITTMSAYSQERQYKKTLQYMHDGRDKIKDKFTANEAPAPKKKILEEK